MLRQYAAPLSIQAFLSDPRSVQRRIEQLAELTEAHTRAPSDRLTGAHARGATPLTDEDLKASVKLARGNSLAFYDALIVAAAADAGCPVLLSEDLQHGRKFGGVTIQNPFLEEP